jgi:hypothetical protein
VIQDRKILDESLKNCLRRRWDLDNRDFVPITLFNTIIWREQSGMQIETDLVNFDQVREQGMINKIRSYRYATEGEKSKRMIAMNGMHSIKES